MLGFFLIMHFKMADALVCFSLLISVKVLDTPNQPGALDCLISLIVFVVRERRHKRRDEGHPGDSCIDDVDSPENLSLDASIDSPPSDMASSTSGLGRVSKHILFHRFFF